MKCFLIVDFSTTVKSSNTNINGNIIIVAVVSVAVLGMIIIFVLRVLLRRRRGQTSPENNDAPVIGPAVSATQHSTSTTAIANGHPLDLNKGGHDHDQDINDLQRLVERPVA